MRIVKLAVPLLLLVAPVIPLSSTAQETTGKLEGRAVDAKGQAIMLVNVVITGPSLQGTRGTQTNAQGAFTLLSLPVGEYSVKLAHLAYQPRVIPDVRVWLDQTTTLGDIALQDQVYPMEEQVVTARPAPIDFGSTVAGANLAAQDYQALPIDRDYKSLATLLPHANQSTLGDPVNFAGATGLENRYFIDGIDMTESFRNSTATNLPYNFVEEVQVKTGGYEAEYKSSLGGTMNVVTYSGGNDFTGRVFGFFTSNGFSATPRSLPNQPNSNQDFANYDFGFGVGGPLRKDRLWYYAAYNPTFQTEDVAIPGWGIYKDHSTTHSFSGKLTWRANPMNTVTLTGIGDPTRRRFVGSPLVPPVGIDPFLRRTRTGGTGMLLEGRHLLRDNLLIKSTLSRSGNIHEGIPETEIGRTEPFFVDSTGAASGGTGGQDKYQSSVTLAGLSCTGLTGDHELKVGAEYKDVHLDFHDVNSYVQQYSATAYVAQYNQFIGQVGSRNPAAFVQDAWRPTKRLQVNAGLRWEEQHFVSSDGKVAQTIPDEWQPRVGFTYQPGRLGTQKLFGSFGRFYQDLTTAPFVWYYSTGTRWFFATYDHDPRVDPSGGDTVASFPGAIQPPIYGLVGQHFDEFTLGYERSVGASGKLAVRGIHRSLRQGLEDGLDEATGVVGFSNPGRGALRAFPAMKRIYSALEISYQGHVARRGYVLGSYVLSRNEGNYEGLYDSVYGNPFPNTTGLYDIPEQLVNGDGPLPNDHTHVFKLSGSYEPGGGVTLGATGVWESGAPLSELGGALANDPHVGFIGKRGSAGRTPSIWDLNLRASYELPWLSEGRLRPRLTMDAFHVASERKAIRYDEVHYFTVDSAGNQGNPNPRYGMPTAFQPPTEVRMGFEAQF